jgi:transcriptional regulator with XRE-family HTH domain
MAKRKQPKREKKPETPKQPFAELPPSLDIRKVGRPSKYDPSYCELVLDLGADGKSRAQIAAALGINRDTLSEWCKKHAEFSGAIKSAQDLALAWWENAGQFNMTRQGFNATAFIFQVKNRFREDYRDASEITGKDGKDLIPGSGDVAKAIMEILREAKPEGA